MARCGRRTPVPRAGRRNDVPTAGVDWASATMTGMTSPHITAAESFAEQAAAAAGKLKPGTWDAVQALALASIAHSLAALAERTHRE